MIRPHCKVSWLEDNQRFYGFVRCLVNREAYQTAMVEHHKTYIEIPLEQLRLEKMG